jgi:predicted hydrocarbon binding protein
METSGPTIARDMENGWVLEEGSRLVTFRIKTFQSFMDRMISLVGQRVGEVILYQMGNEIGHVTYQYSEAKILSDDDLGRVLDDVLATRGRGRCGNFEMQAHGPTATCTLTAIGTPCSHERSSSERTCHIVRGIVAGFMEARFGTKAQSSFEKECQSNGSRTCVFEVTLHNPALGSS